MDLFTFHEKFTKALLANEVRAQTSCDAGIAQVVRVTVTGLPEVEAGDVFGHSEAVFTRTGNIHTSRYSRAAGEAVVAVSFPYPFPRHWNITSAPNQEFASRLALHEISQALHEYYPIPGTEKLLCRFSDPRWTPVRLLVEFGRARRRCEARERQKMINRRRQRGREFPGVASRM